MDAGREWIRASSAGVDRGLPAFEPASGVAVESSSVVIA